MSFHTETQMNSLGEFEDYASEQPVDIGKGACIKYAQSDWIGLLLSL